jgi:hypothetical protein
MATQRIYATIGPLVAAYPHLTAPDTQGRFADNKYKTDLIGAPTLPAMKAAVAEMNAAKKVLGVAKGDRTPISKQTAKDAEGKKVETGSYVFKTKSGYAPTVSDINGRPIPAKVLKTLKIGAGSTVRVKGFFAAYSGANSGMNFTLTDVQVIKLESGNGAGFEAYKSEDIEDGFRIEDLVADASDDASDDDDGVAEDDLDDIVPFDVAGDEDDDGALDI